MDTQQVVLPSSQFMYLVSMLSQKKRGGGGGGGTGG